MFKNRTKRIRKVHFIAVVSGFGIALLWILTLFYFVGHLPTSPSKNTKKTDAIVVLTGGSGRLEEGLRLLENGRARLLFISGVYKGTEVRSLLNLFDRRSSDLALQIAIGSASNTKENAIETSEWMARKSFSSLRLVTGAYHMPRSLLEFENVMPTVKIIENPVFPQHVKHKKWWLFPGTAMLLTREYNKYILAWFRQKLNVRF